ncbi:MAG: cellulase family glycosylhydrolase [Bacteroidota bacterium]
MKKWFQLLFLIIFIVGNSGAQTTKFITVNGKDVIGINGKPFYMKGTNLGNWLVPEGYMFKFKKTSSPRLIQEAFNQLIGPDAAKIFWKKYLESYITHDDIHYLRSIGMNSIRIPFHYKLFTDEDYLGGRGAARGFALMDKVIGWCRQEGLYVLLDMHCAPGGQTGDNIDDSWGTPFLFEDKESQQQTINIWKAIAQHYRNEPAIIGYDLLNEPIATYFDSSRYNKYLEPLYKSITAAIRTVDPNHLIFYGGAQWDSNFKIFGKPYDTKAVYTFHKYWTAATKDVIQDYIDFSNKYKVPIYCGETGENTDEWVQKFRETLDAEHIGWHYWPYKKMDNTRGIMSFHKPEFYDSVIQFADTSRYSFEEIRKAKPKNEDQIKKALDGFINNCLFKNCIPNNGYIRALGFAEKQ